MIDTPATLSRTPRRNTLAACLLVAIGASAMAASSAAPIVRPHSALSNHALFGSAAAAQMPAGRNRAHRGRLNATRPEPARPAANIVVTNCDDSGAGSLRDAVDNAVSGDTIDLSTLSCGTITLTTGALATAADTLSIIGPGADALTIDGNASSEVLAHYGSSLSIGGVTIANGRDDAGFGGCIYAMGDLDLTQTTVTGCVAGDGTNDNAYGGGLDVLGNLSLSSSSITGNTASAITGAFGGGAYVGGNFTAKYDSVVASNVATSSDTNGGVRGGGVFTAGSASVYFGARIADNQAHAAGTAYGGGIQATGAFVNVFDSTISGNTARADSLWSYGGGINAGEYLAPSSVVIISSTVSGNTASSGCGGCFIQGGGSNAFGYTQIYNSTFSGNQVFIDADSFGYARGGGASTFAYGADGVIKLRESTISGNSASAAESSFGYGGGICSIRGDVLSVSSTIAFNVATSFGGGIDFNAANAIYLANSILANNSAPVGGDLNGYSPFVVSGDHNLVMVASTNVTLPPDTLSDDPLLLPLANNGGVTQTQALPPCSPAVDTGNNAGMEEYDQRDNPFVREYNGATDIGAFELQPDEDVIFRDGFDPSVCTN